MSLKDNSIPVHHDSVPGLTSTGHVVSDINEAYNRRRTKLQVASYAVIYSANLIQDAISTLLLPRREHALQYRRKLQNLTEEIVSMRRAIERETISDVEAITERLKSVESLKIAKIRQHMNHATKELESIDRIMEQALKGDISSVKAKNHVIIGDLEEKSRLGEEGRSLAIYTHALV